jgi:hypothetical protein
MHIMNPGGDFGKRELSPALRSRFTEIWIPSANSATDIALIVAEILQLDESCGTSNTELSGMPFVLTLYERNLHDIFYRSIYNCKLD